MKDTMTPNVVTALGAVALAAVALVGWFGLISPQRSKAADLDSQITAAQTQLALATANAHQPRVGGAKPVAQPGAGSELALSRAMPRNLEMPALLRQILRAADRAGVRLDSFTPQAATPQAGYSTVPLGVTVTGRYFAIQRFLADLRTQAGVAGSRVHASGRLFTVDSVSLGVGQDALPQLAATIQMNVFTYGGSPAAAPTSSPATPAEGTTP